VSTVEISDLKILTLRPGDVLLITVARTMPLPQLTILREAVEKQLPGRKVIVVNEDMKFSILRQGD
jgi:hypothetical protein